jgi:hypothetical protein
MLSIFLGLILWGIHSIDRYAPYQDLSLFSVFFFMVFNVIVFLRASYFSKWSMEKEYLQMIYLNFLLKLIFVIGIPVGYHVLFSPATPDFIVPYILIYLAFTSFEVWILSAKIQMRK